GDEDVAVGDPLGIAGDVERSAAPVAEEGVVGGRVPLAQDAPDGLVSERLLEELDHPGGGVAYFEPERSGDLALDLGVRALGVQLDVASEEVVGIDAPEDDVEVGDRDRLEAALGPADADPRAGGAGAELGPVRVRVDADGRAGPGAGRVDPDERHGGPDAGDVRG